MAFIVFGNGRRRGGYGRRGYGYGPRPGGGGCARDACLLESGCCLAESLDGGCLMLLLMSLPQLALLLVRPWRHVPGGQSRTQTALVFVVRTYQRTISARRAHPVCRFTPSCSAYAVQAVTGRGALRGTALTVRRLIRCRPGAVGGHDSVPASTQSGL